MEQSAENMLYFLVKIGLADGNRSNMITPSETTLSLRLGPEITSAKAVKSPLIYEKHTSGRGAIRHGAFKN